MKKFNWCLFNVECQIAISEETEVYFRWCRSAQVCICCLTLNNAFITNRFELQFSVLKNYEVTYKNYKLKLFKNFNTNILLTQK